MISLKRAAEFGSMMGKMAAHSKIAQQPSPVPTAATYPKVHEKNQLNSEEFKNYTSSLNNPSVINRTSPFSALTPEITQKKFFDKLEKPYSGDSFTRPDSFEDLTYNQQKARIDSLTPTLKANSLSSFGITPNFNRDPNYLSQKVRNPMVPSGLAPTSSNISKPYPGFRWNMPGSTLRNQTQYETSYVPANSRETEKRFADNISTYKLYDQNLNANLNRWVDQNRPISEALSRYDWRNYGSADEIQQNILNTARNQLMPGGSYNQALPRFKTYDPTGAYFGGLNNGYFAENGIRDLFRDPDDLSINIPEGHFLNSSGEYRTPIDLNSMTAATASNLSGLHRGSDQRNSMRDLGSNMGRQPHMNPDLYEKEFATKNPSNFMGPEAFGGSGLNTDPINIFNGTGSPGFRTSLDDTNDSLMTLARMYPNNQSAIQSTDKNTPLPKNLYMYNRPNRESYNTIRDAGVGSIDQSKEFDRADRFGFVPNKEMYENFLPATVDDNFNKSLPTRYGTVFRGNERDRIDSPKYIPDENSRQSIYNKIENSLRDKRYKINRGGDPLNKFYSDMYGNLLNAEMPGVDVNESIRMATKNPNAFHNRLVDNTLASLKRNPLGVMYGDKSSPDDVLQNAAKHNYFLDRQDFDSNSNPHYLAGSFGKFNTRTPYNIPETNDGMGKIPKSMMLSDAGMISPAFDNGKDEDGEDLPPFEARRDPGFSPDSDLANQVLGNPWHQLVGRANILTSPRVDFNTVGRGGSEGSPSKTMANMASFLASADAYHSIPGMKPIRMPGISGLNSKQIADMVKQEGLFDPNKGGHLAQTWLMSNNPNARAFRDALTDPRQPDWREEATFTPKQTDSDPNGQVINLK